MELSNVRIGRSQSSASSSTSPHRDVQDPTARVSDSEAGAERTEFNLERSLADIRAASLEIDRVIALSRSRRLSFGPSGEFARVSAPSQTASTLPSAFSTGLSGSNMSGIEPSVTSYDTAGRSRSASTLEMLPWQASSRGDTSELARLVLESSRLAARTLSPEVTAERRTLSTSSAGREINSDGRTVPTRSLSRRAPLTGWRRVDANGDEISFDGTDREALGGRDDRPGLGWMWRSAESLPFSRHPAESTRRSDELPSLSLWSADGEEQDEQDKSNGILDPDGDEVQESEQSGPTSGHTASSRHSTRSGLHASGNWSNRSHLLRRQASAPYEQTCELVGR